jgi:hypothetical protein
VTSSRCSTQDKAGPTPPFPKRPPARTLVFHLISQEADVMGTPYSSIQLENSFLNENYWESHLQSYDDQKYHKLNIIKDLKLVRDGKPLEYWLDINA